MSAPSFTVLVGNIGRVFQTYSEREARDVFRSYVSLSKGTRSRAAGEPVTLLRDGEPIAEHVP